MKALVIILYFIPLSVHVHQVMKGAHHVLIVLGGKHLSLFNTFLFHNYLCRIAHADHPSC